MLNLNLTIIKTLFGNVAAGEVHLHRSHVYHCLVTEKKNNFSWYDPSIFAAVPQVWRSSILLLLVVIFQ
jgi:hypothetical protein